MSTGNAPPQWAADPLGRHQYRYWDGEVWTEHVADHGVTGVDPMASPTTQRRRCGQCGEPVVGDAPRYCMACGAELGGTPSRPIPGRPAPSATGNQRNWTVVVALLVGLAIGVVALVAWASGRLGHSWTAEQRQTAQMACEQSAAQDDVSFGVASGICSCVVDVLEDRYPNFGEFQAGPGDNASISLELISRCLP